MQWYLNVPGVLKVVVLLAPPGMSPVSHPVLSLVEVWTTPSSFRHVMVVALCTVMVAGLKVLELIATVFGGILDEGFDPYGFPESLLHPNIPRSAAPTNTRLSIAFISFIVVFLSSVV